MEKGPLSEPTESASRWHERLMLDSPVMAAIWTTPEPHNISFKQVTRNIDQLGIDSDKLVRGEINWVELIHPDDRADAYRQVRQEIASNSHTFNISYRLHTPEIGTRWINTYGKIYRRADGSARYFESLIIDITEQKNSDQRYRELFLQAEKHAKELRLLDEVQTAIVNKQSLQDLYEAIVESVSSVLGYDLVMITLLKDDRIWRGAHRGYVDIPQSIGINEGLVGKVVKSRKPLLVKDVSKEPLYFEVKPEVVSNICLPFFCEGEVAGVLVIEKERVALNERDLALLSQVTDNLSLAIENVQLHERTRADLNRTQALFEISRSIQDSDNTETMMDEIITSTRQAVSARWAIIYKFDFLQRTIEQVSKTEHDTTPLQALTFEQLQSGLTGWAIQHQQVVLTNDIDTDQRESDYVKDYRNPTGQIRSAIVAPLIVRGKPIGTLAVVNSIADPIFREEDRELISTVASQSALALTQHQLRKEIHHQAFHDSLTGLPNRTMLDQRLKESLDRASHTGDAMAVIFIDLDGFKHINDTLGHQIGDLLLVKASKRLQQHIRKTDTLVRLGGDEFAVILDGLNNRAQAMSIGESLLGSLQPYFQIDHHRLNVGASMGISLYPEDAAEAPNLLRYADSAMYQAKADGKNKVRSFVPELAEKANQRLQLEKQLRKAIENNELFIEYQPQISLEHSLEHSPENNQMIGLEALLRWQHPEHGRIPPDVFIPVAEESGLIVPMGKWVLEQVCNQAKQWLDKGYPALRFAVNISSIQFERDDFIGQVEEVISHSGIPPSLLELELTESVVMQDVEQVIDRLHKLQKMGVDIAIDDFGTGYSSLRYLQQLPLNALKIDRSFITTAIEAPADQALIETIISLAQRFGLRTVAEGVEHQAQLEYLQRVGCNQAQGFYFARPMPFSEIENTYFVNCSNRISGNGLAA